MYTTRWTRGFVILCAAAALGCTGGDMGNTRGGGAAPGQSGGQDTTTAAGRTTGPASSLSPAARTDSDTTTKGRDVRH